MTEKFGHIRSQYYNVAIVFGLHLILRLGVFARNNFMIYQRPLKLYFAALVFLPAILFAQSKLSYIQFNTGDIITGKVSVERSYFGRTAIRLNDTVIFTPKSIRSFQTPDGYYAKAENRSLVLRRISEGKISLYEGSEGDLFFTPTTIFSFLEPAQYISKYGAEPQPANYDNIRNAVSDNSTSRTYLAVYDYSEYARLLSTGVLTGFVVSEAIHMKDRQRISRGTGISAVACIAIVLVTHVIENYALKKVIEEYNK